MLYGKAAKISHSRICVCGKCAQRIFYFAKIALRKVKNEVVITAHLSYFVVFKYLKE